MRDERSVVVGEEQEEKIVVGKTRVCDEDGFVGTVMYVGPVASAKKDKELYAGIVWDDETRGKHDGSVICRRTNQFVRHFSCPSPCGGSFLKLNKLQRGCWLTMDLLQSRYVQPNAALVAPDNLLPHTARTSSGRPKPIEFLGEIKIRQQQQLHDLSHISLRSLFIRGIVPNNNIPPQHHLLEIDLAANLLSDWHQVIQILDKFPNVERASFAANRLCDIPHPNKQENKTNNKIQIIPSWRNRILRVLNLNGCNLKSFQTIQIIGEMMPQLEELCVAHGNLSDMEQISSSSETNRKLFSNLKLLDCSHCQLTQWEPINRHFGTYPSLTTLILDDNPLTIIKLSSTNSATKSEFFESLTHLQLAGTSSSTFDDVHDLHLLHELRSLRFRNNPLTHQLGTGEARALLIGRLATLTSLNGSTITQKERMEAERRYVTNIARELSKNDSALDEEKKMKQLQLKHPRLEELMSRHKEAMIHAQNTAAQQFNASTIAQCAINVTITSMSADSCTMQPIQKRLPSNLKVGRLKVMCLRAFHLDVDLQLLHFKSHPSDPFPTELDDDENTLAFYGVPDGAQVYMNEIDVEAKQREAQREADGFHQRLKEQELAADSLQAAKNKNER